MNPGIVGATAKDRRREMHRTRKMAVLAVAAVLMAGGLVLAAPAFAGGNDAASSGKADCPGTGTPEQAGHAHGNGPGWGGGHGDGVCLRAGDEPVGELTGEQGGALAALAEQHKLSGDLYRALADQHQVRVFHRTARGEERHLEKVRILLDRYQVADPTAGLVAGEFADPEVQADYDRLLADGSADLTAALAVGRARAQHMVDSLDAASDGVTASDVVAGYEHLLESTRRHLTAFENCQTD